jgi:uncharacterized RDD family membrane protein YckC
METNPYAAPSAVVDDAVAFGADELEARKATRWQRLAGALIDSALVLICLMPFFMEGYNGYMARAHGSFATTANHSMYMGMSICLFAILIAINCVFLNRNGQSIGKRVVGTKIVHKNGSRIRLSNIILARVAPVMVFGFIPLVGRLINVVDALMIFGRERRCLHDLIADTIVIRAD